MTHDDDDDPYRDAHLYDLEYADHDEDIAWYQALAWQAEGPVLELGCGTGRLTLPMAQAGATVTGVDLSHAMLDGLRERLAASPPLQQRVEVLHGDFRTLRLGRRFDVVLWPFNALHHCRDDAQLDASLQTIRAHLAPGGVVGLDAYLPDLELYDRDPQERFEERHLIDPSRGEAIHSWEQGWYDHDTRIHHVVYHYASASGLRKAHLTFRMWTLDELRQALSRNGFVLEHEAEDFRSSPLTADSLKYVATMVATP
jgi:SAM-dependent methyltransferase